MLAIADITPMPDIPEGASELEEHVIIWGGVAALDSYQLQSIFPGTSAFPATAAVDLLVSGTLHARDVPVHLRRAKPKSRSAFFMTGLNPQVRPEA